MTSSHVALMGVSIVRQGLQTGLLDELVISLVRVVDDPGVTHLTYRVLK